MSKKVLFYLMLDSVGIALTAFIGKWLCRIRGCSKMMSFCHSLFWGERKIAQIGQTELKMPINRHF